MPFYSRTPPIIKVRRAEPVDIPHIEKLMYQPQTYNFFGETDLHRLLEMAYLSLVQQNSRGDIITFISLFQHPNISSIPKWDWGSWLHGLYRLENVTLRNTLYIHMLLWHPRYSYTFLKSLLRTIFLSCVFVKNIILIVPPRVVPSLIIDEFFTQVFPVMEIPDPTLDLRRMQKIRLCVRQSLVPKLKIRYAVEEDHDDLVPILNDMTDRLREFYGEFYLAELIAYPTEQRKVIVAEVDNVAVGLACLNADINLEVLNENFELAPFYGLRCVDENDQFPLPEAELADSRERLHEISVIYSDDSISKLAPLDTLYEESDLEASSDEIMPESYSDDSGSDDIIIFEDTASTMILRHFYDDDDETDRDTLDESVQEFVRLHAREISSDNMTSVTDFFISEKTLVQHHGTHHTEEKAQVLKIPTYNGAHNAFSIDLFGLRKDYDERQAFDFLEAAFECFPNMDFCLLTVPSTFPVFPLLQHFVRLTPRPLRTFNHEVFVTHRDAILGELDVRPATRSDITAVTQLIGSIQQNEAIRIDLLAALNNEKSTLMAYVMTCENNVVAVAILTRLDNPEYIRANYAMEDFIRFEHHRLSEHGRIKHLVMCPVFQMHGNHFLRQLMRMSDFNCLYYTQFPCENIIPEELRSTPITVIGELIPVAPRPLIEYHASSLEVNMPDPEIISQPIEYPFSLYFMSRRYSSKYKVAVNDHIVIVGASLTSLSFLETLVFGPWSKYLSFNNLTLVSPHGLPGDKSHHSARDFMIPYFGRFSSTHLAQLSLRTWVNVVYGALTGINRAKKYIQISGENMVQYDYLILLCPEQFQKPYPTSRRENVISDVGDCVRHAILKPMEDLVEYPQNVFLINSEVDATNSLTILKHLISHRTNYNIIVYGHCFEAFSCIAALQEFGIPNKNITFVEPFPIEPHSVSVFNDVDLDECVLEGIKKDGITVYSFYYFTGWELKLKHAKVTKVMFESKTKAIALDCIAMFYYGERGLSMRTFQAIIRSSLVFDGRLVIDREFRTNDHSIYAAGAFTKYKRKYYSEYLSHRFFNSIEVGQEMAMYLMQKWDPTFYKDLCVLPPSPLNRWRPYFNKPLVYACRLPGGMRYLSITRPGKPIPVETAMVQDDYGQVFVTGNCNRGERYFRIHFNNNWCVENITCYCNQDIDIHNLMCLYGKHEKLLNNLVERFETGQISDFYDYFREPWAYAVFQDRFNLMQMETHQIIKTVKEVKGPQIILEVLRAMDVVNSQKLQKIPDEKRTEILKHYRRTWEEELVTERLLGFLYKNAYHLPMYVHPDRLKQILGEYLTPSEENKD